MIYLLLSNKGKKLALINHVVLAGTIWGHLIVEIVFVALVGLALWHMIFVFLRLRKYEEVSLNLFFLLPR